MQAYLYQIPVEWDQRPNFFGVVDISRLLKLGQVPAEIILEEPDISLYSLDFERQQGIFVKTPPGISLSTAPFYNVAQLENALEIFTISFETMIQLGEEVPVDDDRIVLIYSVGRCGSTLASQVFAQVPGVINMSEPVALTNFVVARNAKKFRESDLLSLLKAAVRLLCKSSAEQAWVIKGRSFDIEIGDWMHHLFPHTKNLFLYRQAESWLRSSLRAFDRREEVNDDDRAFNDKNRRDFMNALVPEIAQIDREKPLSHVDILSLMWLATMSRYTKWVSEGIEMMAIKYDSWLSYPQKTAEAMLDYCDCKPGEMSNIYKVLKKDSQA